MKSILMNLLIRYKSNLWQFSKFGIVGGVNTLFDFSLFFLLYSVYDLHYLISQVIAYGLATVNGYFWNHYWTFQGKHNPRLSQFAKFVIVYLLSLGGSIIILFILYEKIGIIAIISKVFATFFTLIINYSLNCLWVFRTTSNNDKA